MMLQGQIVTNINILHVHVHVRFEFPISIQTKATLKVSFPLEGLPNQYAKFNCCTARTGLSSSNLAKLCKWTKKLT